MIPTLLLTIITESVTVLGYCIWREKPIRSILLTSICANVVTQSLLWVMLNFGFRYYLPTLLIAEFFIWLVEGLALYFVHTNRLKFNEAMLLSLAINAVSFALGWFLPI